LRRLFVLGYLFLRSNFFLKILGILLVGATFGYLIDSFTNFPAPDSSKYRTL
jgi:hypothetical protein